MYHQPCRAGIGKRMHAGVNWQSAMSGTEIRWSDGKSIWPGLRHGRGKVIVTSTVHAVVETEWSRDAVKVYPGRDKRESPFPKFIAQGRVNLEI